MIDDDLDSSTSQLIKPLVDCAKVLTNCPSVVLVQCSKVIVIMRDSTTINSVDILSRADIL